MVSADRISVELVYIAPSQQVVLELTVPSQATIRETIEQSCILEHFPEIDLTRNRVGIFNELRELDSVVEAGDRVEIYRPLKVDPMEARRQRAADKRD